MRVNRFEDLQPVVPVRSGFRSSGIEFHDLMTGAEGTPGNYGLQLVRVAQHYHTPRHRHNFEQVRVMLEGEFGFGDAVQRQGTVGYFCEGTYYTQDARGPSTTLLLQIGGPSGQGFMSRAQLRGGIDALATRGQFRDGVFTWHDAAGKKHNQDSYEAVWEHVHGVPVRYPAPQYLGPVMLEPERFEWVAAAHDGSRANGALWRDLGRFNGRGLTLAQLRLAAGCRHALPTRGQSWLVFCTLGEGQALHDAGSWDYARWTTVATDRDEAVTLAARTACEFFMFGLPDLHAQPLAC